LELLGAYELPMQKNVVFIFLYGPRPKFMVICHTSKQRIGFGQLTWDKEINNHDLLLGLPSVTNITMTTLPQQ
jgi:outer membrane receptor for ferrienterochelin and colicins